MEETRKLVTVRKVLDLQPIEGADAIEVATVDGWKCVVKKGDFKVGDFGVYFEIDSVLPELPEFEFMRARHFRVRTIRLRGQLSQGLLMPFGVLTGIAEPQEPNLDLAQVIGVTKYEAPIPAQLAGTVKGNFPAFISKTDQERVQNIVQEVVDLQGKAFEITEKLDGTSMTAYWKDGEFGVCSRNLDIIDTEGNAHWEMAKSLGLATCLAAFNQNIALQGELIGEGIQKNPYKLKGKQFRIFDVFDITEARYMTPAERYYVLHALGLDDQHVPFAHMNPFTLNCSADELIKLAEGKSALADVPREGLVFKCMELVNGNPFHFKVISNSYLENEE